MMTTLIIPTKAERRTDPDRVIPPMAGGALWWDAFLGTETLRQRNLISGEDFPIYAEEGAGSGYTRLLETGAKYIRSDVVLSPVFKAWAIARVEAGAIGRVLNNLSTGQAEGGAFRINDGASGSTAMVSLNRSGATISTISASAMLAAGYTSGSWLFFEWEFGYTPDTQTVRVLNLGLEVSGTGAVASTIGLGIGSTGYSTSAGSTGYVDFNCACAFSGILSPAEQELIRGQLRKRAAAYGITV